MSSEARNLPLGNSSFERLRQSKQIYVDKTQMVFELATTSGKYFLARPRRFGKSLLVSTFESLFKHGVRDFEGLEIQQLWNEDVSSYKVVRLDFSRLKVSVPNSDFCSDFDNFLEAEFGKIGFCRKNKNLQFLNELSNFLSELPVSSLVLLIDEYDAPLTSCLEDKELFESVRTKLSGFYSILKSNDSSTRFLFITGVTKFTKTTIFSELNNLYDISLDPTYGTLLGYTHKEVEKYFPDFILKACTSLEMEKGELLDELTKNYDGFCFDEQASTHVFAPWSILKFFLNPERGFKDYWFESGGQPSALVRYFKSHSLRSPEEYGNDKTLLLSTLSGPSDFDSISDLALLTQAGYLTIKAVKYNDIVHLGYPNSEVRTAMAKLYMEMLLKGRLAGQVGAGGIAQVLAEDSPEALFHILNRLFASIDYQNYPVKDEASLRGFVQVYFAGAGLKPWVEHHSAMGRSDLEVNVNKRHWILEFKVASERSGEEDKLKEAVEQLEKYGNDSSSKDILKIALVFSKEKRSFIKWKAV